MNSFWLFFGTVLVCTGFGTPLGIIILVLYFVDYIKKDLKFSQYNENTFNVNNLNVNSDSGYTKDDLDTPMEHMSKESREEMR